MCFRKSHSGGSSWRAGKASNGKTSQLAGAVACGKEDGNSDPHLGPWQRRGVSSRGAFE